MKYIILWILIISHAIVNAQTLKTTKKQQPGSAKKNINPTVAAAKPDTIKINIPKEKNYNPVNSRLSNAKIKTPVYNNQLTGTNAPGDMNTGISPLPVPAASTTNKDSLKRTSVPERKPLP